ncbi:MAG TPA: 50S ribosomal protein L30 [Candidatus Limnocylindrales bacterium]|nr:50S ribosomal protein L30 [Candidatus Limnocylindrales bacterium]
MAGSLRITLRKSPISYNAQARGTVRAMGLRRIGQTVELPDNPAVRGMARAVRFLVEVEEVAAAATPERRRASTAEEETPA